MITRYRLHFYYRITILSLFFVLCTTIAYPQFFGKYERIDSSYVMEYKGFVTSRFYLLSESIGFNILPANVEQDLIYYPNIKTKVGLAAFYKWYGLGLAVRNPFYKRTSHSKGKSRIIDLRINGYGRAFSMELSYQDYHGFYLKNTKDVFGSLINTEEHYKRPDMQIKAIGCIFYFLPNYERHSIRAAYIQTEKQLKSSGSLMFVPSFLFVSLNADSSLIPHHYAQKYNIPDNEHIIDGKFWTTGMSVGYSYTLVFLKNFYVNLSFVPGVFHRSRNYSTNDGANKDNRLTVLWLGRGALGYDTKKFFIGAGGVYGYNNAPFPEGNISYNFDLKQFRVWIGTRFNVKKQKNK